MTTPLLNPLVSTANVLHIAPQLDQIDLALAWLRGLAREAQWPERTVFGLVLSLDEALTNIIHHSRSAQGRDTGQIHLACTCETQGIVLRIEDHGMAFDPTQATPKPQADSVEDAQIGGHGLRLMRHYLKSLHYAREGERNVLTLVAGLEAAIFDGGGSVLRG